MALPSGIFSGSFFRKGIGNATFVVSIAVVVISALLRLISGASIFEIPLQPMLLGGLSGLFICRRKDIKSPRSLLRENVSPVRAINRILLGFASIVLTCLVFAKANAYEVIDVCAEFVDTGQKYKVEAQVYAGYELIRRTGDHGYDRLDDHAVIFWDQGTSSVIELEFLLGNASANLVLRARTNTGIDGL